jgi:hypothetical protein
MQAYEGGLGGEPGNEAHGGYTFCGLAALMTAGCPHALDLQRLLLQCCLLVVVQVCAGCWVLQTSEGSYEAI